MDIWTCPLRDSFKAKLARFFAPGYSCCMMCGMPWKYAKFHTINYSENRGFFTMCEKCWDKTSVENKIDSARRLAHAWAIQDPFNVDEIKKHLPEMIEAIKKEIEP